MPRKSRILPELDSASLSDIDMLAISKWANWVVSRTLKSAGYPQPAEDLIEPLYEIRRVSDIIGRELHNKISVDPVELFHQLGVAEEVIEQLPPLQGPVLPVEK